MIRFYLKDQVWEVGKNDLKLKYVECKLGDFDEKTMVPSVFHLLPDGHPKKPKSKK